MTLLSLFKQTFLTSHWLPERDIQDLSDITAMVTGASSGLGKETCRQLANKNATVYLIGRSEQKTTDVIEALKSETSNNKLHFIKCDLSNLHEVQTIAKKFNQKNIQLDILINNAGIFGTPFSLSAQGIESQFATNYFAHVVLTTSLLPLLKRSSHARVVNLTSFQHTRTSNKNGYEFNLNDKTAYQAEPQYYDTKLANLQFTFALDEALRGSGVENIFVNAVHPGLVKTEMLSNLETKMGSWNEWFLGLFQTDVANGVITQLYAATSPEILAQDVKGKYLVPYCTIALPSSNASDNENVKKTWEWTGKVLQDKFRKDWNWDECVKK